MRETAWPFWLAHGIDREDDGRAIGFHEFLSLDDLRCVADYRRLRVVTRQTFVFSEALAAGMTEAEEAVTLGLHYLRTHAFDAAGGYHWRFDLDGRVMDPKRDLYDHAFVLLALSTAMKVRPDPVLRAEALALDDYLHRAFPHPAGGYGESLPASLPRRQNPHMHLLEACLAASEAFEDSPFLDRADGIVTLFLTRMFHAEEGALAEYFDDGLVAHREHGRFAVEPGHHSEWVWLLDWYAHRCAVIGRPVRSAVATAIRQLNDFVDRFGIHPTTGGLVDVLSSDGSLVSGSQRLWPQTERLKAEILRPDATETRILKAFAVLRDYITPAPRGLWMEQREADGSFSPTPAPASSLYHLTSAYTVAARTLRSFVT
ncbi:AGE family epimerase/isomerase [Acidisoma cellulosilytica]|uniref:AGE family epimerase/isomerase n=1 Tax=Acidisoma cellulosilyticum TaxID=2802395 RepID=A0A964E3Y4_9PROT|nr:AGE family epimerase/isomerase [Acidisoma cellulosilyticum]